jgi:hypothetical protein
MTFLYVRPAGSSHVTGWLSGNGRLNWLAQTVGFIMVGTCCQRGEQGVDRRRGRSQHFFSTSG